MKKVLLLGTYTDVPYHPLTGVDDKIIEILGEDFEVTCTEDFDALLTVDEYDLFISYTDTWSYTANDAQTAALIAYSVNGGPVLLLHSGISLQLRAELAQLAGAKFTNHPSMTMLTMNMLDDPMTAGVEDFEVYEEPYRFEFDNFAENKVIFTYDYEGVTYPGGWRRQSGKGQVAFLMVGHTPAQFELPEHQKLIQTTVKVLLEA